MLDIIVRDLGTQEYVQTWQAMKDFTLNRNDKTPDEIWLVEHPAVFTLGQAGKKEHILNAHNIPVVESDRGGQVTYHGPGQLIAYTLIDIKRRKIGIRDLVCRLEKSIIALLADFNIESIGKRDMPGVYIDNKKIAAIGLRVKKGCSYHGISFNIDMDLTPFSYINPCGYQGLEVTQLKELNPQPLNDIKSLLTEKLKKKLQC